MKKHLQLKIPLEKLLNLIHRSPPPSIDKIAQLICRDRALTRRVLDLANSSYYGIPGRVTSLTHALRHIGIQTLEMMILVHFDPLDMNSKNSFGSRTTRAL